MSVDVFAAADLGSNSFHLVVARQVGEGLVIVDRVKDMVRLAEGLTADGTLSEPVRQRALDSLQRFGQRLRALPSETVRVVGTNTLRQLPDDSFLIDAEQALGHPIDIVSGVEEARLVYLGAAHSLADNGARRLVVDIGGGSTELIIGENKQPRRLESLYMGCVSVSTRHFPDGLYNASAWRAAERAAQIELEPVVSEFSRRHWDEAIGTSGSVRAVESVAVGLGLCRQGITAAAIADLRAAVLRAGSLERLRLPGLGADRKPVFAAGLVVLEAVFDMLGIDTMQVADGAVREGVLYDLLGRIRDDDVRDVSVAHLAARYHVDAAQATRIRATAMELLNGVAGRWRIDAEDRRMLAWAADLHEIGLDIAHSRYHRHGEYIVANADMAGFSRQSQAALAALVRSHRRKLLPSVFEGLPRRYRKRMFRLAVLLRLAVVLHRGRDPETLPAPVLRERDAVLQLTLPADWLAHHPLTVADLDEEIRRLAQAQVRLVLKAS